MRSSLLLFSLCLLLTLSSCDKWLIPHEDLVTFQKIQTDSVGIIANKTEIYIQPEDQLVISVATPDPEAMKIFNSGSGDANPYVLQNPQNVENFVGYIVDADGNIDFPIVGRIKIAGLTVTAAKNLLSDKLQVYLKQTVINMRFLNLRVTVMGEVRKPGTIKFSSKRLTILEAIGEAGDLTEYANRTNVLVMREKDGKRSTARLNLQNANLLSSPYYYLEQHDVVYVEPTIHKEYALKDKVDRRIPIISAIISAVSASVGTLAYLYLIFKK